MKGWDERDSLLVEAHLRINALEAQVEGCHVNLGLVLLLVGKMRIRIGRRMGRPFGGVPARLI